VPFSPTPAMDALLIKVGAEFGWGEVIAQKSGEKYIIRHVADCEVALEDLEEMTISSLRALATYTGRGSFRPLKSAPDLRRGWRTESKNSAELETALNHLYPGSIADWFAAGASNPPVTTYREFTNRQSGMYRITQMLDDAQAALALRACCHPRLCLKQRLWSVSAVQSEKFDPARIPCLEPCAILLEFARKAMRIEQEEKKNVQLSSSEAATLGAALGTLMAHPELLAREGDTSSPLNPRRVQLLLEKKLFDVKETTEPEES
jgi:hypothetical protein